MTVTVIPAAVVEVQRLEQLRSTMPLVGVLHLGADLIRIVAGKCKEVPIASRANQVTTQGKTAESGVLPITRGESVETTNEWTVATVSKCALGHSKAMAVVAVK